MNRTLKTLGGGLGLLIFGILLVALVFSLSNLQKSNEQTTTFQSPLPSPTPTPPISPIPTPTPAYIQPPLCEFDEIGDVEMPASQLNEIVFSEPEVVFSREAPIEIIEWLPGNQRLLIHVRDKTQQSIEVLNVNSGKTKVYAEGLENAGPIFWLPQSQAVVYVDRKTSEFSGIDQNGLWLSRGNPKKVKLLLDDATRLYTEPIPTDIPSEVAEKLAPYNTSTAELWRYPKYPEDPQFLKSWEDVPFRATVAPDGSTAALYGLPWLYLVDLTTSQPCEVNLEEYSRAFRVAWSPDGRWLAMLVATGYQGELMRSNQLVILDTVTGEMHQPDLGMSHVWEMIWLPDNHHIVIMGKLENVENVYPEQQIALVDVINNDARLMLPDNTFGGGSDVGFQLALSSNGRFLSVKCPIWDTEQPHILQDQICTILIHFER